MQAQASRSNAGIVVGRKTSASSGAGGWILSISRKGLVGGLLVFVGYYLGAQLGMALTFQPNTVSVMWPPNSILLAALVLSPYRLWWFMLACALPAHLL